MDLTRTPTYKSVKWQLQAQAAHHKVKRMEGIHSQQDATDLLRRVTTEAQEKGFRLFSFTRGSATKCSCGTTHTTNGDSSSTMLQLTVN